MVKDDLSPFDNKILEVLPDMLSPVTLLDQVVNQSHLVLVFFQSAYNQTDTTHDTKADNETYKTKR